jgi:hypothetical protein
MFIEQRREPREEVALPLKFGVGCPAVTRDLSPSGMYFEVDGWHHMTGAVLFEMQLDDRGLKFSAEGEIVRIVHTGGKTGFAVRLLAPRLHALP